MKNNQLFILTYIILFDLNMIKQICVFCASSRQVDLQYFNATKQIAEKIAKNNIISVYGGGAVGLMGKYADSILSNGGEIIGVIPRFMFEIEWAHKNLTKLVIVDDLHQRNQKMLEGADAVIALPGGCGTLEELLEVLTLKRLGLFIKPIIMVNIKGFYNPLIEMLNLCIKEKFMSKKHKEMWTIIDNPAYILDAINSSPKWNKNSINFATM